MTQIRFPEAYVRASEYAGSLISYKNGKQRGTDIDFMAEHDGRFVFIEVKRFKDYKIFIPKGQLISLTNLYQKLPNSAGVFVGTNSYDFKKFSDPLHYVTVKQLLNRLVKYQTTSFGIEIKKSDMHYASRIEFDSICNGFLDGFRNQLS